MSFVKSINPWLWFLAPVLVAGHLFIGYYAERTDHFWIVVFATLFICFYILTKDLRLPFWQLAIVGVILRVILLPSLPNFSQDYFRFLWDGQLMISGTNPYLFTPEMYMMGHELVNGVQVTHAETLVTGMGTLNASHFSNYPPVNQFFFALAALFSGKSILGSVIVMRITIILADIGILLLGKRLLESLKLNPGNIHLYFLNPFIIVECTGNLHFEAVMLFFLMASLYFLHKGNWMVSAIMIALSVSTKLIPLIFLPVLYKYFVTDGWFKAGFWRLKKYYWVTIATVILTFLPFMSASFISNFFKTISLWFQNFEFNASIFYIIRWIGFQVNGWDPIQTVGKILPLVVILFVLIISFFRKNNTTQKLIAAMLFAICFYLLLATTVHPWYLATPLLLSVFTRFRFAVLWSGMVMLSYTAYKESGFSEDLWIVAAVYSAVAIFFVQELWKLGGSKKDLITS